MHQSKVMENTKSASFLFREIYLYFIGNGFVLKRFNDHYFSISSPEHFDSGKISCYLDLVDKDIEIIIHAESYASYNALKIAVNDRVIFEEQFIEQDVKLNDIKMRITEFIIREQKEIQEKIKIIMDASFVLGMLNEIV